MSANKALVDMLIDQNNQLRSTVQILLIKISALESMVDWFTKLSIWFQMLSRIFYLNTYNTALNEALASISLLSEDLISIPREMFLSFEKILTGVGLNRVSDEFNQLTKSKLDKLFKKIGPALQIVKNHNACSPDFGILVADKNNIAEVKTIQPRNGVAFSLSLLSFLSNELGQDIPANHIIVLPAFCNLISRLQIIFSFSTQLFTKFPYSFNMDDEIDSEWSVETIKSMFHKFWSSNINYIINKTGYVVDNSVMNLNYLSSNIIPSPLSEYRSIGVMTSSSLTLDNFYYFSNEVVKISPHKTQLDSKLEKYWDDIYIDLLKYLNDINLTNSTAALNSELKSCFLPSNWLSTCDFTLKNHSCLKEFKDFSFPLIFDVHMAVNDHESALSKLRTTVLDQNIILRIIIKHLVVRYKLLEQFNNNNLTSIPWHPSLVSDPLKLLIPKLK